MRQHCTTTWSVLIILAAVCFHSSASAGVITNGDFSQAGPGPDQPFEGWTTGTPLFANFDPPDKPDGFARFEVTGLLDNPIELEQEFFLPSNIARLSFEFEFSPVADGSASPSEPFDIFQAVLLDTSGVLPQPQFPVGGFFPGFYVFGARPFEETGGDEISVENLAGGVNRVSKRVSLDVTSLPEQNYTIAFLLSGADDGLETTVNLDNVRAVVPEPTSIALWGLFGAAALPLSRWRRRKTQHAA